MVEAKDVAFVLHEEWRKTRLKEDGTYEPRWKSINDAKFIEELNKEELPVYVRKTEGGYEIDIANASYNLLSADWQNENKAAAEVVAGLVNSGKEFSRDEVGEIVHNAWLERNSWAKGGELGVPFAQLPKEEQDKDIAQYEIAKTMSQAREIFVNRPLDAIIDHLEYMKECGDNFVYNFNDHNLYSVYDTEDTCYLKVCGSTKKQQREAQERWRKEYIENQQKEKTEFEQNILGFIERGAKVIYPERKEEWRKFVERDSGNSLQRFAVKETLRVIEALDQGIDFEELNKVVKDSDSLLYCNFDIITFSKRGPEYGKWLLENNREWVKGGEAFISEIEAENKIFAENEKSRKVATATTAATISTETTAEPIETKNKNKE